MNAMAVTIGEPSVATEELTALAEAANAGHAAVLSLGQSALTCAIEVGEALLQARALVPRRKWTIWLAENFAAHNKTAYDYMRMARYSALLREHGIKTLSDAKFLLRARGTSIARSLQVDLEAEISELAAVGKTNKEIAEAFGISVTTVWRIRNPKRWRLLQDRARGRHERLIVEARKQARVRAARAKGGAVGKAHELQLQLAATLDIAIRDETDLGAREVLNSALRTLYHVEDKIWTGVVLSRPRQST